MLDLRPLLSPDSVAIIGAAADSSLRGRLTQQLVDLFGRVAAVDEVDRLADAVL